MQLDWFVYSLLATIFIGLSMAFYKMPSFKNYSPFISTFYSNCITALFALLLILSPFVSGNISVSILGIIWGFLFGVTMMLQKIILKRIETNTLFPVTSSLSNVITIGIGILILNETLSPQQFVGISITLIAVYLFSKKKEDFPRTLEVFFLASGIITVSFLSKYIQKLAAMSEPIFNLLFWQFIAASVSGLLGALIFEKNIGKEFISSKKYLLGSFLIGSLMFLGSWAILIALSKAPLSLVYAIHPIYILVTALMGALIFKEKLTKRKVFLIFLTILGVILIKLG